MASNKTTVGADLAIDFNRVNLALAKRQSMLASLMGLSSAAKHPHSPVPEEVSDDFTAEPELLGIGAKKQNDDEDATQILSSEIRLKRQLLPKDFDKRHSANKQQIKDRKIVLDTGTAFKGGAPLVERPRRNDTDSDEDAGRSSLGKRKRERTKQSDEKTEVAADEKKDGGQNLLGPEDKSGFAPQVNETSMDNRSLADAVRKRKKKNKKKDRKAQEVSAS